jgi:Ni/Fe-hydrogenase 1 B-type cytochrome subunit
MSTIPIQRIRIWSGALRVSHWLLAASVLTLLLSGWALTSDVLRKPDTWRDAHLSAGYLLGITLAFRIALLFAGRAPTDRWRDFLPLTRQQWLGMRAMLIFYVSLGRAPLPGYYGHNPLWGPAYLLIFGVLGGAIATGLVLATAGPELLPQIEATPYWLGYTPPEWHDGLAVATAVFAALHVLSAFAHDARGTASEISAMVNGHKIFLPPHTARDLAARIKIVRPGRAGDQT